MSQPYIYQRYFDLTRIVLWGDKPETTGDEKTPKLQLGFRDGNPRFIVNTGVMGLEGMINFPSDIPTMASILVMLQEVAEGEAGKEKYCVDSLAPVYVNDKPTNEKRVVSKLYVGKSKDGMVYLSVITEGKPKLIFTIKPTAYHAYRDRDNNKVADSEISRVMAIGLSKIMLTAISQVMVQYSMEEYAHSGRKQGTTNKNATTTTTYNKPKSTMKDSPVLDDLDDIAL